MTLDLSSIAVPPPDFFLARIAEQARQAAEEGDTSRIEALREECRSLIGFTTHWFPRYRPSRCHYLVAEQLERVERGEIDRLMLLMPPRHGKTTLASKSYPAHCIGKYPQDQFISAAATDDLASDWGREVRNIISSELFQTLYPDVRLAEDSKAAGKWNTMQGGGFVAAGVGSRIVGRGGNRIMIDDAFGSMKDAESETVRNGVWQWYCGTLYHRLEANASIVVINHRMHQDDLSGRLIEQMKAGGDYADQWTIVELPAIAVEPNEFNDFREDLLGREPGEPLWPERFPIEALEVRRRNMIFPRYWSALFQQNPLLEEGEMFKVSNIRLRQDTGDVHTWVRGWDLASSDKKGSAYSAGVKIGRTKSGGFVVGHVVRERVRRDDLYDFMLETAKFDTKRVRVSIPQDPGQAGVFQVAAITKHLAGFVVHSSPESGEKDTRAMAFASQGSGRLRAGIPGGHLVVLVVLLVGAASFVLAPAVCSGLERGGSLSLLIASARSPTSLPSRKPSAAMSAPARAGLSCPPGETSRAGSRSIQRRRSSARIRVRRPRLTARNSPDLMAS